MEKLNKYTGKRKPYVPIEEHGKAETQVPPSVRDLPMTPAERRDQRREAALAEADASYAARAKREGKALG